MSKELTLNRVWETKEIAKLPKSNEAKLLLEKIRNTVEPVMKRKKWTVKVLAEFYPDQPGLLGMNVNRGQKILIRLRKSENVNDFFPWEHLIGTMIHELTHMQIGPHSSDFYKLMDEIADEVDNDMVSGITAGASVSTVFQGQGYKLGGNNTMSSSQLISSRQSKTQLAAEAALKRLNHQKYTSGSGKTLSDVWSTEKILTKEELRCRAAAAAQRRLQDDVSCRNSDHSNNLISSSSSSSSSNKQSNHTNSFNDDSFESSYWICSLCDVPNLVSIQSCTFCLSPCPLLDETKNPLPTELKYGASSSTNGTLIKSSSSSSSSPINDEIIIIDDAVLPKKSKVEEKRNGNVNNNNVIKADSCSEIISLISPVATSTRRNYSTESWSCQTCTFLNNVKATVKTCEMCGSK